MFDNGNKIIFKKEVSIENRGHSLMKTDTHRMDFLLITNTAIETTERIKADEVFRT
jgi:hypothetical protein